MSRPPRSLYGLGFNTNTEKAERSPEERMRLIEEIRIEGVMGEFWWFTSAFPCALAIEDNGGPWWSFRSEPAGASSMKLQVNEKSIEVAKSDDEKLECRLFLDASVSEFFCNRLHAVTSRIYRKPEGPLRVRLTNADAKAITSFHAWQLKAISAD